jgi:hypothetical protein
MEQIRKELAETEKKVEHLEEDIGMIDVYKEIIRDKRVTSRRLFLVLFIALILSFLLLGICLIKDFRYSKFREDSITKQELIEYMDNLHKGE